MGSMHNDSHPHDPEDDSIGTKALIGRKALAENSAHGLPSRRRLIIALFVMLMVIASGGSWWAGSHLTSASSISKIYQPPPKAELTAPVVDKVLSESINLTGTVSTGQSRSVNFGQVTVPNAISMYTSAGPSVGTSVKIGSVVAEIAGRPVIAMLGSTPMYRAIEPNDIGADVLQLQNNLRWLGYYVGDAKGTYGPSTQRDLSEFYQKLGYSPPPIITLAASQTSMSSAGDTSLTTTTTTPVNGVAVPQAEIVFLPELPAVVSENSEAVGQSVANPSMVVTWGQEQVSVPLTSAEGALVQLGQAAVVTIMSAGNPMQFTGTVGRVEQSSSGGTAAASTATSSTGSSVSSATTSSAVITTNSPIPSSLVGSNAQITITTETTHTAVLAVPVSTLYSLSDGTTALKVLRSGKVRQIVVQVGMSVGGYVEVKPTNAALLAGDSVVIQ